MILFQDVDGCLNSADGGPIGFSNATMSNTHADELAHLGELLDASDVDHFIINTGRCWDDTAYLCDAIKSTKTSYAIVEHGCSLWDIKAGKQIDLLELAREFDLPHATEALATIERVQQLITWFGDSGSKLLANAIEMKSLPALQIIKSANLTMPVPKGRDGDIVMAALEKIIQEQHVFAEDAFTYHHSRSDGFIDVMGTVDKGIGVELAIAYLGYDISQTAAVGNGLNDLPMLNMVGLPICPGNSEPQVKSLCEDVGLSSQHHFIDATKAWLRARN